MRISSTALLLAAACASVAVPLVAQQDRLRLPPECRDEIAALCGTDRGAIRACLREKRDQLSQGCGGALRERIAASRAAGDAGDQGGRAAPFASARVSNTVIYGADPRQQVDVYAAADAVGDAPLVLFVHGGGWQQGSHKMVQAKPDHFKQAGYVFASTGYRLLPDAPVEQQAADLGAALRALRAQAEASDFDPDRIVLIGHSAGAHLAALVASDPQYAGDAFGAIRGVVLLDGAGYDVAAQQTRGPRAAAIYEAAFGNDPARQKALSPITHVGGRDAPNWLALYVAERAEAKAQSEALVAALARAGAMAAAAAIPGIDHMRMNRDLGTAAGAAQTQAVDAFLARVLGD